MRKKIRTALLAILAFVLLTYFYPGFTFDSTSSIAFASATFAFVYLFVRPLIKILSLPLNIITFGLFSLLVNVAVLYLISVIVPGFEIVAFQFEGCEFLGVSVPSFYLNTFLSTLVASVALSASTSVFLWVFS
jgi:putative membrane protein